MGGPHDCLPVSVDVQRLEVALPDPPRHYVCGNAYRRRMDQHVVVEGPELKHLKRFFERIQDDDEVSELRVEVRRGHPPVLRPAGDVQRGSWLF
jgi:hypothetical protein